MRSRDETVLPRQSSSPPSTYRPVRRLSADKILEALHPFAARKVRTLFFFGCPEIAFDALPRQSKREGGRVTQKEGGAGAKSVTRFLFPGISVTRPWRNLPRQRTTFPAFSGALLKVSSISSYRRG